MSDFKKNHQLKYLGIVEDIRKEEVEEGPQLVQVVLEGSTRDEEAVGRFEFTDDLGELRFLVLDTVGFIDDHVAPVELLENGTFLHDDLVRGDAHVPLTRHDLIADNVCLETNETVMTNELHEGYVG